MDKDIVIGAGKVGNCWSKAHCYCYSGSYWIAENSLSYSISDGPMDLRFYMTTESVEGKKVAAILSDIEKLYKKVQDVSKNLEDTKPITLHEALDYTHRCADLDEYLTRVLIHHIPFDTFIKSLEDLKAQAFRSGKEDMKAEFRKLLGVASGY